MGLLDSILDFFFPRRRIEDEEPEEITFEEFEQVPEFFERVEEERKFIRRKIAKTTYYCELRSTLGHHKRINVYAVTFEDNDTDRFDELINEIETAYGIETADLDEFESSPAFGTEQKGTAKTSRGCTRTADYGYDDSMEFEDSAFTYPVIETGEE